MSDEVTPGWDADHEKLRCFMLLEDDVAEILSDRAGCAYFRAFIVEDRATSAVRLKYRFRYENPDERSWFLVTTNKRGTEAVEHLRGAIADVLRLGAQLLGLSLPKGAIKSFYPPDDGGDVSRTIIWLEMKDLIEITEVREIEGDAPADAR